MTTLSLAPQRVPVRRITPAGALLQSWWAALSLPVPVEQVQPSRVGTDALTVQGCEQESSEADIEVRP